MTLDLSAAIARYGADAKAKLSNPSARGEPEDQLRAPLERLFADLTELCGLPRDALAAVGESSIAELQTRPDYSKRSGMARGPGTGPGPNPGANL